MARATARLSAITGDGSTRSSTSYSEVMRSRSVADALGARHGSLRSRPAAGTAPVERPARAILILEQHQITGRVDACGAARLVQQHQRGKSLSFGIVVHVEEPAAQPDRLAAQVRLGPCVAA
jgi:hypothetical protein